MVIKAHDPAAPTTQTESQTEEQKQKAKEAVETKATALLEQIVAGVLTSSPTKGRQTEMSVLPADDDSFGS